MCQSVSETTTTAATSTATTSAAAPSQKSNEALKKDNETLRRIISSMLKKVDKQTLAEVKQELLSIATATAESLDSATSTTTATTTTTTEAPTTTSTAAFDYASIAMPEPNTEFWKVPLRSVTAAPPDSNASPQDTDRMHVVHITAELAPLAKVGGLGDVVTGLARAVAQRGHIVETILPFYECIDKAQIENLRHECDIDVPKGFQFDGKLSIENVKTSIHRGTISGCEVILIRPESQNCQHIFKGGAIYGGGYNEIEAYLYLCRSALEYLKTYQNSPSIIHLHEWQTSAASMLYWDVYHEEGLLQDARVVLTIHNMDNPGECRAEEFEASGISGETYMDIDKAMDERTIGHNPERMSLLKGGIIYSNAVTTVSPSYARETLEGGAAGWLGTILAANREKYHGILNGIDTVLWDPARDANLPCDFTAETCIEAKAALKKYVQTGLGLEVNPDKPLIICVSRLVPQKGLHLIRHAIDRTAEWGGQFVLLGSGHGGGDFQGLAEGEYKDHPDIRLLIMYNETLSHLLFAASDITLVPSLFEPCGLTQMCAMRYGSLPLVRRTGGLADTVVDVDSKEGGNAGSDQLFGNGYVFDGVSEGELDGALRRALDAFKGRRGWWSSMQQKVMGLDWSWSQPAAGYVDVYRAARK